MIGRRGAESDEFCWLWAGRAKVLGHLATDWHRLCEILEAQKRINALCAGAGGEEREIPLKSLDFFTLSEPIGVRNRIDKHIS
jgi:hypothetical protein